MKTLIGNIACVNLNITAKLLKLMFVIVCAFTRIFGKMVESFVCTNQLSGHVTLVWLRLI